MLTTRHLAAWVAAGTIAIAGAAVIGAPQAGAAAPGYQPHTALINGESVTTEDGITNSSGDPISLEEFAAEQAGFAVTVVSGADWQAMSAADFAKYQLLVVGDPICNYAAPSAVNSASTWAPVVMGTAGGATAVGNRVVVGTDPEYHYANGGGEAPPSDPSDPTTAGAEQLVQTGITYAGGVDGATGVYFDTSCADPGRAGQADEDLPTLFNRLSVNATGWTEDDAPPCGGSVQLVASVPEFMHLTDAEIQGWDCSDHLTYPTYPTDWQPLAVATDTTQTPTCGTDPGTGTTACGEAYVLIAGRGIVVTSPDLSLAPATDSAPAGGSHTVTATVSDGSAPVSGVHVDFTVTGQNAGVGGTCVPASCDSDGAGEVAFTYADVNGAGQDTINASAVINSATEHANADMTWTAVSGLSVDAGPNVMGPVGTAIGLAGSASGATSTVWSVPAGTPCTFGDPAAVDTTITCTVAGTYTATLTATDGTSTVSDTTKVKVTPQVTPPPGRMCHGQPVTIMGTPGDDTIVGTRGDDVIFSGKGADVIDGRGGSDIVCAGAGNDTVRTRSDGDLFVKGGGGNDLVRGGVGDDVVVGGVGDDVVRGGPADDRLRGGPGDDRLIGDGGTNVLDGNGGTDACGSSADGTNTYQSCESTF